MTDLDRRVERARLAEQEARDRVDELERRLAFARRTKQIATATLAELLEEQDREVRRTA